MNTGDGQGLPSTMEIAAGFSSLLQDLTEAASAVPPPQRASPPPQPVTPDSVGGETRDRSTTPQHAGTAGSARNSPPLSQMPPGDQSGKHVPASAAADDGTFRVTQASVAVQLRAILASRGSSSEPVTPVQQLRLLTDALDDCTVSFNGRVHTLQGSANDTRQ